VGANWFPAKGKKYGRILSEAFTPCPNASKTVIADSAHLFDQTHIKTPIRLHHFSLGCASKPEGCGASRKTIRQSQ
jgi:hypothetical protein